MISLIIGKDFFTALQQITPRTILGLDTNRFASFIKYKLESKDVLTSCVSKGPL